MTGVTVIMEALQANVLGRYVPGALPLTITHFFKINIL